MNNIVEIDKHNTFQTVFSILQWSMILATEMAQRIFHENFRILLIQIYSND